MLEQLWRDSFMAMVYFVRGSVEWPDSTEYPVARTRLAWLLVAFMALTLVIAGGTAPAAETNSGLKLATFDVDATPPVGSMMAYDKVLRQDDLPLRCRGVVLMGAGEPIVLCALDWIGVANESQDVFKSALAE